MLRWLLQVNSAVSHNLLCPHSHLALPAAAAAALCYRPVIAAEVEAKRKANKLSSTNIKANLGAGVRSSITH
jgi:hypothetical protein